MAIEEPPCRHDRRHPSFRPDRSGASKPEPRIKSAVVAKVPAQKPAKASEASGQHSLTPSRQRSQTSSKDNKSARSPQKKDKPPGSKLKTREESEKEKVWDKAHVWIANRANRLDPRGYVEETRSLRFFGHQQVTYGLQMVAIVDWAWVYIDLGMVYPLPTLPPFLFCSFVASHQTANTPLVKDESLFSDTDELRRRF